jgi:predicted metal-dependent hydrolase
MSATKHTNRRARAAKSAAQERLTALVADWIAHNAAIGGEEDADPDEAHEELFH